MMVLAVSTRRRGQSLAGLARERDRPPGGDRGVACRSSTSSSSRWPGLGIVVVKALGGEQVPMKAGTVLVYPQRAGARGRPDERRPSGLQDPARLDLQVRRRPPRSPWSSRSRSTSRCPTATRSLATPTAKASCSPRSRSGSSREARGGRSRSPDDPDRAVRRLVHVQDPQGQGRRGVADRRGDGAGRDGAGGVDARIRRWSSTSRCRANRRSTRSAIYGFIASMLPVWLLLCPRDYLSSFLKIGTIVLLVAG